MRLIAIGRECRKAEGNLDFLRNSFINAVSLTAFSPTLQAFYYTYNSKGGLIYPSISPS